MLPACLQSPPWANNQCWLLVRIQSLPHLAHALFSFAKTFSNHKVFQSQVFSSTAPLPVACCHFPLVQPLYWEKMRLQSIISAAVGLAILPQHADAWTARLLAKRDDKPGFPVKPDTIASCTHWYDNWMGEECKVVRDWYFAISPEDFHRWNPSISLDCKGWEEWHSYCIGVEGQSSSSSSTSATPKSTSTFKLAPTPTPTPTPVLEGWEPMGCFIDDHTLRTKSTREGGSTLTVEKCQAACWLDGFEFVGLKSGTECWCGTFVGGDWTKDQEDCKMPCPGDSTQKCGGDELFSVFRAVLEEIPLPEHLFMTTSTAATMATSAAAVASPETASAGDSESEVEETTSDNAAAATTSDSTASPTTSDSAASTATRVLQGCSGISILTVLLTGSGIVLALY